MLDHNPVAGHSCFVGQNCRPVVAHSSRLRMAAVDSDKTAAIHSRFGKDVVAFLTPIKDKILETATTNVLIFQHSAAVG